VHLFKLRSCTGRISHEHYLKSVFLRKLLFHLALRCRMRPQYICGNIIYICIILSIVVLKIRDSTALNLLFRFKHYSLRAPFFYLPLQATPRQYKTSEFNPERKSVSRDITSYFLWVYQEDIFGWRAFNWYERKRRVVWITYETHINSVVHTMMVLVLLLHILYILVVIFMTYVALPFFQCLVTYIFLMAGRFYLPLCTEDYTSRWPMGWSSY